MIAVKKFIFAMTLLPIINLDAAQALRRSRRLKKEAPEYSELVTKKRHRKAQCNQIEENVQIKAEEVKIEEIADNSWQNHPLRAEQNDEAQDHEQQALEENMIQLTEQQVTEAFDDRHFLEKTDLLRKITTHPITAAGLVMKLELAYFDYIKYLSKPGSSPVMPTIARMKWNPNRKKTVLRKLVERQPNMLADLEEVFTTAYQSAN
jgi:hypothetical protein